MRNEHYDDLKLANLMIGSYLLLLPSAVVVTAVLSADWSWWIKVPVAVAGGLAVRAALEVARRLYSRERSKRART